MPVSKKNVLYTGKAKTLYETDDPGLLVVAFRDDTTAFDGEKHEQLLNKGSVNRLISGLLMQQLSDAGVPTHFVEQLSPTEDIVKRLRMIPLECVIRNVAAGSLCRRLGIPEKQTLNPPLFEFFLKNDALHDPLVTEQHALAFGWATPEEMDEMKALTFKINHVLQNIFDEVGLILVDAKFEFGVGADGKVYLGDEISPDACRIWDKETLDILDKDRFRQDMGDVIAAYQQVAERLQGRGSVTEK